MMLQAEDFVAAGILISVDDQLAALHANAALEWMRDNTTLQLDMQDKASIEGLPACAKLFVTKYAEVIGQREGVASQSIEGLSVSYLTMNKADAITALARALLRPYMRSQVRVVPAKRRW